MGVDVSTWRARVGMFTQTTSQKSLFIFRAQNRNQIPNHHQAPWPVTEHTIPGPETYQESGSTQQDDYKPYSTQPSYEAYSHVAWAFILLFCVLLIDAPSQPRPPPSCPPPFIYPDQNETSPMQLSYVQLLLILTCGDVEVNPGPSSRQSFADRATELTRFTVPVEDVNYPEYCSKIDVDFTLKRKDGGYMEQMKDIVQTVCAMLNYAGGIITLNPKRASTVKHLDEWTEKIQHQLDLVVQKEVLRCIEMKLESGNIEIWLRKSWKFITYKFPIYIRRGNGTQDGDISMISEDVDTKPSVVSKVTGIQWQHLNHGHQFPLSEGMNLEFKCFDYESTCDATSLMERMINDKVRGEPKLIKTLLAFTNTEGGGDVIIGIKEDTHGVAMLQGQNLPAADEGEVQRCLNELIIKGLNGQQRIWPSTPNGSEWAINFYPLRNCPRSNRHVLIHIRVNQVSGCVLAEEPEAYTMTPEGNIKHVPLNEWKRCIKLKSIKPAHELLKLGKQDDDEVQDNAENDIDEEQFKQLVNDLKSHRVTLSLKHIKSASWTKDGYNTQDDIVIKPGVNMHTCVEEVSKSELLKPSCPTTWVPEKPILDRWVACNHPGIKQCIDTIEQSYSQEAVVIGAKCLGRLLPRLSLEVSLPHAFDFCVLQGSSKIDLWIVFGDYRDTVKCRKYANSAVRILRSLLLNYMHQQTNMKAVKLAIRAKVWSTADNCIKYEATSDYTESTVELPVLQKAVAYCLLQGQSHIKNRLGEEFLMALTKDQLSSCLQYDYRTVLVVLGPPGSGKSIIAQHLCDKEARDRNIGKDKLLYISPTQPLAEFMKFQGKCEVIFMKSKKLAQTIRDALKRGILLIIVDDAHLFQCSKHEWSEVIKMFEPRDKDTTERHLAIFLDPHYQNLRDANTHTFFEAISVIYFAHPFSYVEICNALPVMIRNSRNIFAFFRQNAEEGSFALACSHDFQGDGVSVSYTSESFFSKDINNPVIRITKEIVGKYNFEEGFVYRETDITILVDSDGKGKAEEAVKKLQMIFHKFYPEAKVQRASQFPVQGIVIEELISFSGLDTRVCILVMTSKNTSVMDNPRYKCYVASRGITKLVFLLHGNTVDRSFRQLKFSEEKQWQKLTGQLLKEITEKGSSEEWLKTNVPDTECWHKTDLGEQIQERMKTRQEVKEWMGDATELGYYWSDSPHYQRVALHALCQLAVTWQGDKCTVDKDLLFHYIPQLFCSKRNWLQLLYAVQCVLHHLQNPPGLAVAVLQAVLTPSPDTQDTDTKHKPLITTTDWDKWRNTQNPLYEEGRNIIQEQGQLLDLLVMVRSGQTLPEINSWISANIQQDQMLDAFIITAECLIMRGEEMTLIWDWISQNVPQRIQTVVQDTVQTKIIQKIPSWADYRLIPWMDRHILPAWRQDAQFVRAALTAVCERTMYLNGRLDQSNLQGYLGSLNCLYGAPEALQLQALESVYDHVTTLQHPEKVLQEVLDIMWYEGYISRQVIVSWLDNMDETSAISPKRILIDSKKDLGEQIQERMRARQEVRRWMGDTTQLGYYWNDFPHYQRVALHALCQLAVTWQGDKCAVDKDLLFLYMPRLFSLVKENIQLLYAVQCVVYQLGNHPGLAEFVPKALVSPTPYWPYPIITASHLEEWRKTKHPSYEEGREIMLQATKHIHRYF